MTWQARQEEEKMKCPKCKKKIERNSKFCEYCGEKVSSDEKKFKPFIYLPIGVGAVCAVLIIVAVVFLNPQETTAEKLQKQLDLGEKYLASADFENAKVAFDKALEIDEKSPDAALGLAKVFNEQEDPDQALLYLQKASDSLEEIPEVTLTSGETSVNWEEYESEFDKTIELFETNGNAEQVQAAKKEKENASNIIVYIEKYIVVVTATPQPTPEAGIESDAENIEEDILLGENDLTVTPAEESEPTVTPVEDPVIIITDEPVLTVTPTEKPQETATITPEPDEQSQPEDSAGTEEIDGIPVATDDGTYVNTENPIPSEENPNEMPGETEEIDQEEILMEDAAVQENPSEENLSQEQEMLSSDELLQSYIDTVILAENSRASFGGTAVAYDYGSPEGALGALNGILGIQRTDVNWDGIPEILAVSMENGKIAFSINKIIDGNVEETSKTTAVCEGMGHALSDMTYGSTQECFIKDDGSSYYVGIASHCFGLSKEVGNPAAETSVEIYKVDGDGNVSLQNAVTIQNGSSVFTNGDPSNAGDGGKDLFMSKLSESGFSGSWISESADALVGMDLGNNPQQDMTGVPDPIAGGLASKETGVQDLVIVSGSMGAGSGSLSMSIEDKTSF